MSNTLLTFANSRISGVCNPKILAKIGVKPKTDLRLPSVGENVQEHIFCALVELAFSFSVPSHHRPNKPTPKIQRTRKVQHSKLRRRGCSEGTAPSVVEKR
ncbi:hypothetical protein EI94DRAFT_1788531 [Lactarius quietus]|nr:hypothetical protein EI94DRAFT_1788531 [Lactarius quietus]